MTAASSMFGWEISNASSSAGATCEEEEMIDKNIFKTLGLEEIQKSWHKATTKQRNKI